MKFKLLIVTLLLMTNVTFSQNKSSVWNATTKNNNMVALDAKMQLPENKLFNLNLLSLKTNLNNAPARRANAKDSNIVFSIPNADGVLERFSIYENPTMDPALAARSIVGFS